MDSLNAVRKTSLRPAPMRSKRWAATFMMKFISGVRSSWHSG